VIVDHTARPSDRPPPSLVAQTEQDPAIGRARTAYAAGNQQLFASDIDGAIRADRQALDLYRATWAATAASGWRMRRPGTAPALSALRTYVTAVPNARDAALLRKRIARLQGK
jgi:hypothetical protein